MINETKRPTNPEAEKLLGLYFPVLDHGFISLIDYSGTDECIERAARVSYGAGTRRVSQTSGLLRYLKRNGHTSPSEMVNLKFHMSAPLFVLRQFFRHRTLSANECSARYSLMPMLFYTPAQEHFQKQAKNNKQGRSGDMSEQKYQEAISRWNKQREESSSLYTNLTEDGVAREIARIDLPLSTYSQLYFTMNLHNLFHFIKLRCDSHAQYEIRAYANIMAGITKFVTPISFEAWVDYDFCGKRFSRQELDILSDMLSIKDNNLTSTGKSFSLHDLEQKLSKREVTELLYKLQKQPAPDFTLDLQQAKSAEYFEKKMAEAVPEIGN